MRMRRGVIHMVWVVATVGVSPAASLAQIPTPTRCGVGIPQSEQSGYVPLPHGDVFCPLVADPKGHRSFVTYLRESSDDGDVDVG
ncbi:MAG TPA: hypothetical protein VFZ21_05845, partial [Gemmatimonadaceae bacterium]|nr:hypothetical protein [Gemmatimonadaceae bacterium]